MPDQHKNEEVARLEQLNDELTESLNRCRDMLHDYQARLAANSNEAEIFEVGLEGGEAHGSG